MLMLTDEESAEIRKMTTIQKKIILSKRLMFFLLCILFIVAITGLIPLSIYYGGVGGVMVGLFMFELNTLRYDHFNRLLELIQKCRSYEIPPDIKSFQSDRHQ